MMEHFDVVIVGASFSGLTLARHLPQDLKVLIVDAKPKAGATVESTGLITEHTRQEFASFFEIDQYITNPITAIAVIAPNYKDYFVSHTPEPWIYQTDTKALMKGLAKGLPQNVNLRTATAYMGIKNSEYASEIKLENDSKKKQSEGETPSLEKLIPLRYIRLFHQGKEEIVATRFLVGADGGHSKVASTVVGLDKNREFLFGFEQVFFGEVHLGPCPEETIYHFWFGEFSLGYGGWLSPTIVDGKKALRIGLAKLMKDREEAAGLLKKFLQVLLERKMISINGDLGKPDYVFGSHIPIGGVLKRISADNVLLIGDAGGFCGAFAADGIKGSVVSGKEGAKVITRYFQGEKKALNDLKPLMNKHRNLLHYYSKQVRYRWIWDCMKRNRTFHQMYKVIESEKEKFLEQFCDSKDKRRSLAWTVLKLKNIPKLAVYSWFILVDIVWKIFQRG